MQYEGGFRSLCTTFEITYSSSKLGNLRNQISQPNSKMSRAICLRSQRCFRHYQRHSGLVGGILFLPSNQSVTLLANFLSLSLTIWSLGNPLHRTIWNLIRSKRSILSVSLVRRTSNLNTRQFVFLLFQLLIAVSPCTRALNFSQPWWAHQIQASSRMFDSIHLSCYFGSSHSSCERLYCSSSFASLRQWRWIEDTILCESVTFVCYNLSWF